MTNTNPWNLSEEEFARRENIVLAHDTALETVHTIPQGVLALIIENGIYLGEVPAGTYTPETFWERIKVAAKAIVNVVLPDQPKKQIDVVLVRQEDVQLDLFIPQLPTAEYLLVDVLIRLVVQIEDIGIFAKNFLGNRLDITIDDLKETIGPIIDQSLRETVRRLNIESLFSPEARDCLVVGVQDAVQSSLRRYGITCTDIHVARIVNPEYNEQLQKTGEIVILDLNTQQQEKLNEAHAKARLLEIAKKERDVELNVLAAHAELNDKESEVALLIRQYQIEKDKRKVDHSNELSKEESAASQQQIDVLRLEREFEFEKLTASIELTRTKNSRLHEIELTRLNEEEDTRQWRRMIQDEIEKSEHHYQETMKKMERQHELNAKNLKFLRADELEQLLQKQKTTRMEDEIREEQAARDIRIHRIGEEYREERAARATRIKRIEDEYADEQKRRERAFDKEVLDEEDARSLKRREEEREERRKDEDRQLDAEKRKLDSVMEAHKLKHQMDLEAQSQKDQRDVTMRQQDTEDLKIKTAADVEIAKHESQVQVALREEAAQRERELQDQRVRDADQRVRDAQAANSTTTDAILQALATQGQTFGQAFQAFGNIGQSAGQPTTPVPGTTNPNDSRVIICVHCRAENKPGARFCPNCGKEL